MWLNPVHLHIYICRPSLTDAPPIRANNPEVTLLDLATLYVLLFFLWKLICCSCLCCERTRTINKGVEIYFYQVLGSLILTVCLFDKSKITFLAPCSWSSSDTKQCVSCNSLLHGPWNRIDIISVFKLRKTLNLGSMLNCKQQSKNNAKMNYLQLKL